MSGSTLGTRRVNVVTPRPVPPRVGSAGVGVDRAVDELASSIGELTTGRVYLADVDLIVGDNAITHSLGRKPVMVYVTPNVASATFGWAWDPEQDTSRPDVMTVISVAGIPMTCRVEVRG